MEDQFEQLSERISKLEDRIEKLEELASSPAIASGVPEDRLAALETLVAKNINRAV